MEPIISLVPMSFSIIKKHLSSQPFQVLMLLFDRRTVMAEGCGHTTRRHGIVKLINQEPGYGILSTPYGRPIHCLNCIVEKAIPCAWCGRVILPADPVTLSSTANVDFKPGDSRAVLYDKENRIYVGCTRDDCNQIPGHYDGYWDPPNGVFELESPLSRLLKDPRKGLAIHDTHDLEEVPTQIDITR